MTLHGGARDHQLWESWHRWVYDCMDQLGWFDPSGGGTVLNWRTEAYRDDQVIEVSTLIVSQADTDSAALELGSALSEDRTAVFAEIYAPSDAIGRKVTGDLMAICQGKYPGVSEDSSFPFYDWRQDPPELLGRVEMEDIQRMHGGQNPANPEMRHWWGIALDLVEERA